MYPGHLFHILQVLLLSPPSSSNTCRTSPFSMTPSTTTSHDRRSQFSTLYGECSHTSASEGPGLSLPAYRGSTSHSKLVHHTLVRGSLPSGSSQPDNPPADNGVIIISSQESTSDETEDVIYAPDTPPHTVFPKRSKYSPEDEELTIGDLYQMFSNLPKA